LECYFGLNLRPMSGGDPAEASYTIVPNMAYFEFLLDIILVWPIKYLINQIKLYGPNNAQ
jgi:hypothetical protein